jgi:hypothetical protein
VDRIPEGRPQTPWFGAHDEEIEEGQAGFSFPEALALMPLADEFTFHRFGQFHKSCGWLFAYGNDGYSHYFLITTIPAKENCNNPVKCKNLRPARRRFSLSKRKNI